jgi:hypothetical protein
VVVVAGPVGLWEGHGDAGAFVASSFSEQFREAGGMTNVLHLGGWWLRYRTVRDGRRWWSLTWAPLGMAEVFIEARGFVRLLWRCRDLSSRVERAKTNHVRRVVRSGL